VTKDDLARWLGRYVEAWRTYDPDAIGELFSEEAEYRYHPYDDEPVRGRAAIVASWLEEDRRDEPGTWDARYEPVAVDGDVAVATGTSTYLNDAGEVDRVYYNNYVMRFDSDGRCRSFTEYYMKKP
jgi:hypothetical protein